MLHTLEVESQYYITGRKVILLQKNCSDCNIRVPKVSRMFHKYVKNNDNLISISIEATLVWGAVSVDFLLRPWELSMRKVNYEIVDIGL